MGSFPFQIFIYMYSIYLVILGKECKENTVKPVFMLVLKTYILNNQGSIPYFLPKRR
nr:MAG TPA: hypothetical protein [Caudoviricetes sp.]